MHRNVLLGAVLVLLAGLNAELPGQVTGQIMGYVVDQSGSAIPGASVKLLLPGGERPLFAVTTNSEGLYIIVSVRSDFYDLVVELAGFQTRTIRNIKVDPAQSLTVPPIRLEVGEVKQEVAVVATAEVVQLSTADVSTTITNRQLSQLPMINRSPLALINTQAGVSTGRGTTVINGQRTSYSNVTIDGINIQDNFIRSNALDYLPNLLLLDQVAEVTISTSNASATVSGGASQVNFVTPSGSNKFHGGLVGSNRMSRLSANTWFNNRDGIPRPFLNQNQLGGSIGGPIKKDVLFFYGNYEAFRLRQNSSANRTILTSDARQGIYTYRDSGGVVQKVSVLQAAGVSMDPAMQQMIAKVPGSEKINNFRVGDSSDSLIRNTGGYSFLNRNNRTRDNVTGKIDYHVSSRHSFSGSYLWNRDILDRPAQSNDYSIIPKVTNDNDSNLLSVGWRWNPSPYFTNELRGGFNLAPGIFNTSEKYDNYILGGLVFSNPVNTFRAQGRFTDTYNYFDNASYARGKHQFQFGVQIQRIAVEPYDDAGITPTYTLGIGTGNTGLTAAQLPGISASDLTAANNLLANLAGYATSYSQTFNVKDRTSGFVNGAQFDRHFSLNQYSYYIQDNWKVLPRLTATLGLRNDYLTPVDERDSLVLLPKIVNNDPIGTLLSNATLDFAGNSSGRPWYKRDRNNFAPNVGLAWDVFGNGKTALRAGYSISYVNDETIRSLDNNTSTNSGLASTVTRSGLSGRLSAGLPAVTAPVFKVPRTFEENYLQSSTSAFGLPDPNLVTPYVQEWNLGIQHDIKGTVFDLRYVGNHGTKAIRAFDYNQVIIKENGFLDDFIRAQNNGYAAVAAGRTFNPAYDASIPGSQPLTVFPRLGSGGLLTNATILNLIQTGQPGELASTYQTNGLNGAVNFFRNPFALGTNMVTNYSNSNYHALQFDIRHRLRNDLDFQTNYTFSKVLSDASGDGQTRFEAFLDNASPNIERARAPFDITHAFKFNGVYSLPAGAGHRFNFSNRVLSQLMSGWGISGILTWQSGGPISVLSGRGTLNRSGRSTTTNTADSTLTLKQLEDVVKFRMSSNGPYIIAASAIGSDGRGVGADGSAPFNGQAFFHPGSGRNGSLQRRTFNGPSTSNLDFALMKVTKFGESQSIEIRMDASNIFNHPTWDVGDQTISSTTFGRITASFYGRRLIQLSAHYRF